MLNKLPTPKRFKELMFKRNSGFTFAYADTVYHTCYKRMKAAENMCRVVKNELAAKESLTNEERSRLKELDELLNGPAEVILTKEQQERQKELVQQILRGNK